MYPPQAPWSGLGQLESQISSLKSELSNKVNSYELSSIKEHLSRLEQSIQDTRTEIAGNFNRFLEFQQEISQEILNKEVISG